MIKKIVKRQFFYSVPVLMHHFVCPAKSATICTGKVFNHEKTIRRKLNTVYTQNGAIRSEPMKILRRLAKNTTDSILRRLFGVINLLEWDGGRKLWQ